ncbi:MAG: ATP-binding protein [bacterium]
MTTPFRGAQRESLNAVMSSAIVEEHDGVVLTDRELCIVQVNAPGLALLGFETESDVVGRGIAEFVAEDSLPRAVAALTRIRHSATGGSVILGTRRHDGSVMRTECGVSTVRDEQGVFAGYLVIFHGLTEIEPTTGEYRVVTPQLPHARTAGGHASIAVTDAERRLSLIGSSANEGIFEIDLADRVLTATPRFVELLRLHESGAAPPHTLDDLLARAHPEDWPRIEREVEVAIVSALPFDAVCRLLAGREYRWFRIRFCFLHDSGKATHFIAFMADVTDQQRQSQLLEHATRLARIGAWQYVRETGQMDISSEFFTIFEVDRSEIPTNIGQFRKGGEFDPGRYPVLDRFLTAESRARFDQSRRLAVETGEGFDLELEAVTARGRAIWVRCLGILDKVDGRLVRAFGAIQDVTSQHQMQEQLSQALKMESIGHLTSGIAHDFNNLLTVIRGHLELALAEVPKHSQLADDLAEVDKAARSASALTQQLLVYSRKDRTPPVAHAIPSLFTQFESTLRGLIGPGVSLHLDAPHDLWPVRMDASQMEQLLMNLSGNARDAMSGNGALIITARNISLDEYDRTRGVLSPGDYVELLFRDSGPGMPPSVAARAFDPLFTTKQEGRGTGLGLSICQSIATNAHGSIDIASTSSQGTILRVRVPRMQIVIGEASAPHQFRGTETLLVCDDEPSLRALISAGLRAYGYQVLEARDPAEALTIAEQHVGTIHMLVTDVLLPQMSGKGLAASFLAIRPGVPVLYMSGLPAESIARSGERFPATPFLAKPFSPSTLARRVREMLDGATV